MSLKRAFIYCRISLDKKVGTKDEGAGVDRQEKDCRKLAKQLKVEVVDVFVDNSVSAYSGKVRPDYKRMLEAIEADKADVVLAWHPDRLHRSPVELNEYIDLVKKHKVQTHTCTAGGWDLSTASGRVNARVLGDFAAYESEQKRDRIVAEQQHSSALGKRHGGGARPFGYQRTKVPGETRSTYELDPVEAPALADAIRRITAGESIGSIMREWDAAKIKTVSGKVWTYSLMRSVLRRPTNGGIVRWVDNAGKVQESTGNWEPIVPADEQRALMTVLSSPERRVTHNWEPRYLCPGLVTCGECQSPLRSHVQVIRGAKRKVYRCTGRTERSTQCTMTIGMNDLDREVKAAVVETYRKARRTGVPLAVGVSADAASIASLRGEQAEVNTNKAELIKLVSLGALKSHECASELQKLTARQDEIAAEVQRLVGDNAHAAMLDQIEHALDSYWPKGVKHLTAEQIFDPEGPDGWDEADEHLHKVVTAKFDSLSLTNRRALIGALLQVKVNRGRGIGRIVIDPKVPALVG